MKKTLLFIGFLTISTVTFGQSVTYGFRGGLDFAKIAGANASTGFNQTTGFLTTFSFGVFTDLKFKYFSVQPALVYSGKGGQVGDYDGGFGTFNLRYIQIPVNVIYHIPIAPGNIYVGAGPYLAFGVGGSISVQGPAGDDTESVTFGGNGDFQSTELGVDGLLGIQFNSGFVIHLNYDYGLSNMLNDNSQTGITGSFKSRTIGVSVGFVF